MTKEGFAAKIVNFIIFGVGGLMLGRGFIIYLGTGNEGDSKFTVSET